MEIDKTLRKQYKNIYIEYQTLDRLKKHNLKGFSLIVSLIPVNRVKLVEKEHLDKLRNVSLQESLFISSDIESLLKVKTITNMETCFINTGINDVIEFSPTIELAEKGFEKIKNYLKVN